MHDEIDVVFLRANGRILAVARHLCESVLSSVASVALKGTAIGENPKGVSPQPEVSTVVY